MKIAQKFCLLVSAVLCLISCDDFIETGRIDGQDYFVPRYYRSSDEYPFKLETEQDQNIGVRALWPEFSPIIWDQTLRERGIRHQKISILISRMKKNDISILLDKRLKHAPYYVGQEYGLRKQIMLLKKNAKAIWNQKDLRLEEKDGKVVSFIECDRTDGVYKEENKFPQCSHHFFVGFLWFKINYDKKMLSQWKDIQEKTLALYESFKSRETAIAFYIAAREAHEKRQGPSLNIQP